MRNQGFTAFLSGQPFTRISCDQVIEMTINRALKYTGALSGKTENAGASERWMRINHLMATLIEKIDTATRKRTSSGHLDLGRKRLLSDEQEVYLSGFQRYGKTINLLLTLQLDCRKISFILDIIVVLQSSAYTFLENWFSRKISLSTTP